MQQLEFTHTMSEKDIIESLAACLLLAKKICGPLQFSDVEYPENEVYWHIRESVYETCKEHMVPYTAVISEVQNNNSILKWLETEDLLMFAKPFFNKVSKKKHIEILVLAAFLRYFLVAKNKYESYNIDKLISKALKEKLCL